ncbi:MAG: GNAT family N-acetyltransferase, partial [Gammaproteobacteria bacterium]
MLDRETDGALGGPAPTAEIIADAAALDGIAEPWNKLFAEARPGNPFTSFEWCRAWWRGFGRSGKRLHVIAVYRRAALIGIIPLYREKYSTLGEVYRFLGTGRSDFPGVLAAVGHERAVLDAAWTSVVERLGYLDVLDLQDQKATDPFIAELRRKAVDARLSVHVRTKCVAPRIQFGPGGWDGYLTSKGASFRKRTRKIERRIAKTEGLAVARYQTSRMDGSDC